MSSTNVIKMTKSLKDLMNNVQKLVKPISLKNGSWTNMKCLIFNINVPKNVSNFKKHFCNKQLYASCNRNLISDEVSVISQNSYSRSYKSKLMFVTFAGFFTFFQTKEDEEESELIMTIKRAVLMIQHDEFKGAEQLLHVALRLAQQTQNSDGVTYIHDLLANVAFAQGELDKAEILFKDVMQRVLSQGTPQDDLKIIHMSLKLAKIYEQKNDWLKAEEGYKFCINHLHKQIEVSEDEDVHMLWGMTLDWYARFLHEQNRIEEAFSNYKKAYEVGVKLHGELHEQNVILLNDLGTISFLLGESDSAMHYMAKAVEIGKHLPNMEDFSAVYVNLGNIYLKKEMYNEAQKQCAEGLKNAKRHKNEEGLKEATICLEEIKKILGK